MKPHLQRLQPYLLEVTGNERIDHALAGVVHLCEMMFPDRISGYYLVGSLGCGYAVTGSDIDLFMVFKNRLLPGEERKLEQLMPPLWLLASFDIDLKCLDEDNVRRLGLLGPGRCIFGKDVRLTPPSGTHVHLDLKRFAFYQSVNYFFRLRGNPHQLAPPLSYPDEEHPYKGYSSRPTHALDGRLDPGLRELLNNTLKPASVLVDLATGEFNKDKQHIARLFGEYVDAGWVAYLEEVEYLVRRQWAGREPDQKDQKKQLQHLCQQALDFENSVLGHYRAFILAELQSEGGPCLLLSRTDIQRFMPSLAEAVLVFLQKQPMSDNCLYEIAGFHHLLALNALARLRFRDQEITEIVALLAKTTDSPVAVAAAALSGGDCK